MADLTNPPQSPEDFVRMLLWDDFPECCGRPVVGAEYMGQQEMLCCGEPERQPLSDARIVAALRERFSFCEYCGGNDESPPDHCMDCARPDGVKGLDGQVKSQKAPGV